MKSAIVAAVSISFLASACGSATSASDRYGESEPSTSETTTEITDVASEPPAPTSTARQAIAGLPEKEFVGDTRVGGFEVRFWDKNRAWVGGDNRFTRSDAPDIVECLGPKGQPLRVTGDEFFAAMSSIEPNAWGLHTCDGQPVSGWVVVSTSSGPEQLLYRGEEFTIDEEGNFRDAEGRIVDLPFSLEDGEVVPKATAKEAEPSRAP